MCPGSGLCAPVVEFKEGVVLFVVSASSVSFMSRLVFCLVSLLLLSSCKDYMFEMSRNYTPAYNPGGDLFSEDESFSQSYEAYEKRRADILKEREDDRQNRVRSKSSGVRSRVSDAERDRILEKLRGYGVKNSATGERSKSGMVNSEGVDLSRVKGARFIDVDLDNSHGMAKDADEINDEPAEVVAADGGGNVLPEEEAIEGSVHQDSGVTKEDSTDCGCMEKCDCACCNGEGVQGEEDADAIEKEATDNNIDAENSSVADAPVVGVTSAGMGLHCDCGEDCKCDHGKHASPHHVDEATEEELSPEEHIPLFVGNENVGASSSEHGSGLVGEKSPSCDCGKGCDCESNKQGVDGACDCGEKCKCVDCHCVGHGEKEDIAERSYGVDSDDLRGDESLDCDCGKGCKCEKCDCADCHCVSHGKHQKNNVLAEGLEPVGHGANGQIMPGTGVGDDDKCGCCDKCDLPGCQHDAKGTGEISEENVDIVTAPYADVDDIEKNARGATHMREATLEEVLGHGRTVAEENGAYLKGEMPQLGASDASDEEFGEGADWVVGDYAPPVSVGDIDNDDDQDDDSAAVSDVGNIYGSGTGIDSALPEYESEDSRGAVGTAGGKRSSDIGVINGDFGGNTQTEGTAGPGIKWGLSDNEFGEDEEFGDDSVDVEEPQEDVFVEDLDDSELDEKAFPEDDEEEDYSWDDDLSGYDGVIDFSDIIEDSEMIFADESEEEEGDDALLSSKGNDADRGDDAQHEAENAVSAAKLGGYKGLSDDEESQGEGYELPLTFNGRSTFLDFDR
ncbi:TRP75-related protein [Candidatus Anaplasma sp. TIGMIC]|uniref:TRP75-related protein n=1 Tax=Candidatus Anaplasma sp. TIGMIC TaxID=3020713 RepID=UPI00232C3C9B|nr:TRP75-related protein [Candidatus Anaplasma sp. TIGMIC]MDB1135160.1 TRP75-related protein [Candidatus Anaplasma sp. TIGMIC]